MAISREEHAYLGRGIYSRGDAARLLRIDLRRLNRWVHGYRYSSSEQRAGDVAPLLEPELPSVNGVDALSFRDLTELLFVAGFRNEGLSLQYIRRAASVAADRYGTHHPFSLRRFGTDGKKIFATLEREMTDGPSPDDGRHVEEVVSGQLVFKRVVERYLRQLEYHVDTGATIRWWPLGRSRSVALDPSRSFGAPINAQTGVPTRSLFQAYMAEGADPRAEARVAEWFGVSTNHVRDAIEFEKQVARAA